MKTSIKMIALAVAAVSTFAAVAEENSPSLTGLSGSALSDSINNAWGNSYINAKNNQGSPSAVPSKTPQATPHAVPQKTPVAMVQSVPQRMNVPQAIPQATPQIQQKTPVAQLQPSVAQAVPQSVPQRTPAPFNIYMTVLQKMPVAPAAINQRVPTINVAASTLKPSTQVLVTTNGVTQVTTAAQLATTIPGVQVAVPYVSAFQISHTGNRHDKAGHSKGSIGHQGRGAENAQASAHNSPNGRAHGL